MAIIITAALAAAALAVAVAVMSKMGGVIRRFAWIQERSGEEPDSLATLLKAVQDNKLGLLRVESELMDLAAESRTHFKRVGLVRFDAFEGVAGQQSYSLCLLNDSSNGVIISSLVGNNFSRGYCLEIRGGEPSRKLGDEEGDALAAALDDSRVA